MNSFFMDYTFSENVGGFPCTCKGERIYSVSSYESVDTLITDAQKILKRDNGEVTFICYSGYDSIALLRLFRDYDGTVTACHWKYNKSGYACENWQDEKLKNTRATVKKYVLEAIQLFNDREAA